MGKTLLLWLWGTLCFAPIFLPYLACSQSRTVISGKVTDQATGDAVPFVNVFFYGTQKGTTTDFEGRYSVSTYEGYDSIVFSYIGYKTQILSFEQGATQQINVELESETVSLDEIVVMSGENPAWGIIRQVVRNKEKYNKRNLDAYEYDSYTKIELDIDNITDGVKNEKVFRGIAKVMDSIADLKGDNGNSYIPIFFSEALSKYYVKNNPYSRREDVSKTKVSGIAIEDGTLTSQVVGAFYQEYNFYNNWLKILDKDFISPIADGWRMYYDYEIMDTVLIGADSCFQLKIIPNRKEDPAFMGNIWITKDSYALKRLDVQIDKSSNLNFIEKIKIQQELTPTNEGYWLPLKSRILMDAAQPSENAPGIIAKFYNSIKNWELNKLHPPSFYENQVNISEDMLIYEPDFWEKNRYDSLTKDELLMYKMIDTLKTVPIIKTGRKIFQTMMTGYFRVGKVDIGPYLYTWANNNIEGNRFVAGLRSNEYLSRKFYWKGYLAYGTADSRFKYRAGVGFILKRKPWTEIGVQSKFDIEQVGLNSEKLTENYIFYAATKFNRLIGPYELRQQRAYFETGLAKGLQQRIEFNYNQFNPLYKFEYYQEPSNPESAVRTNFQSTSIRLLTHWGRDESYLQNGNYRINMGPRKAPVFDFAYTYGFTGILSSDINFHKFELQIEQKINMGFLGTSNYRINGGYILGQVPYPVLENHVGSESLFYTTAAFNTMNYSEFVSDHYVSFKYYHSFQGLIMNKVPLIRKLKWRLLGTASVLYGGMRQENLDIIPETDENGDPLRIFNVLDQKPYVEVGYGIENIFKIVRIDFLHRLTYKDLPDVSQFQVKISFQLIL